MDALRIGCVPDLPLQKLQSFLGPLHRLEADLQVEVVHLRTRDQLERLLAGEQDVGLIHHVPHPEAIEIEAAFPGEPLVVHLAVGHHLADRPSLTPEELHEEVLLVGPREADPALSDRLDASLADAGYRFRDRRETAGASVRDLLFAVAEGRGIALGPVSALTVTGDLAAAVVRRSLERPLWMPDTMLAWRTPPPRPVDGTLEAARAVARQVNLGSSRRPRG